jgi:hypothetical protein
MFGDGHDGQDVHESAKRKFVVNAIAKGWMCSELTQRISTAAFNVRTEDHTVLERLHGQCRGDKELPQQIILMNMCVDK